MANRLKVEYVKPEALKVAGYNPRTISERDMNALCRSLEAFGMVDPIIARRKDSLVIGGHQRLDAAVRVKLSRVPVIFLDNISDKQAQLLNVALNKITGAWDIPKLGKLFEELSRDPKLDLTLSGFTPDTIQQLVLGDEFLSDAAAAGSGKSPMGVDRSASTDEQDDKVSLTLVFPSRAARKAVIDAAKRAKRGTISAGVVTICKSYVRERNARRH